MRCVVLGLLLVASVGCEKPAANTTDAKVVLVAPVASGDFPENWSHKELIDHVQKAAPKYVAEPTQIRTFYGPAVIFRDKVAKYERDKDFDKQTGVIYCQVRKTPQEAKDEAGPGGAATWASGRFYFKAEPKTLAAFKAAIGK